MISLVDTAAYLIDIRSNSTDSNGQFFLLGVIHLDDLTVNEHLPCICPNVFCAKLCHLVANQLALLLGHADFNANWSGAVGHVESSFHPATDIQCRKLGT